MDITKLLKYFKDKGFKKATCISLTILMLINTKYSVATYNANAKSLSKDNDKTISDIVTYKEKSIQTSNITNEEKINIILERENLTKEEFAEIVATVIGEAAPDSYTDAYAVINTFYNRKLSEKWINEVLKITGIDNGDNLYAQITLKNQSSVYSSGLYKEFLGITDVPAYQAVIDFLYSLESMHDYLCFYASFGSKENKEQFVDGGNLYYSLLTSEDRKDTMVLVRTNKEKHETNRY